MAEMIMKRPPDEDVILRLGNAMIHEAATNGASSMEVAQALVRVFGAACDTVLRLAEKHGGTENEKMRTLQALLNTVTAGAAAEVALRVAVLPAQQEPS